MKTILCILFAMIAGEIEAKDLKAHKDFTRQWEGISFTPYKDAGGHSIGVGHFIPKGFPVPSRWTPEKVEKVFSQDMEKAIKIARKVFKNYDLFPQDVKLILADMAFNMGEAGLLSFKKMIAASRSMDYSAMAHEMKNSKWYSQTGNRAKHHVQKIASLKP